MSQQEITRYFKNLYGQKVCGSFDDTQLSQDVTLPEVKVVYLYVNSPIHPLRKFLLALLFLVGLGLASCNTSGVDSCKSKNGADSTHTITGVWVTPVPTPTMGDPMIEEISTPPEFKGGIAAIISFLIKNIQYPDIAIQHNISGNVIVRCFFNAKGTMDSVKVLKGLDYSCEEEAIRVIKKFKRCKPAMKRDNALPGTVIIPV